MRLNGRIAAAALTGVLVAGGTVGGYLLTSGTAKADNATQCEATPATGGVCNLLGVTLPATSNVYLQFSKNMPSTDSAKVQVTWNAVCDGQTLSDVNNALPPNVVYLDQNNRNSCTVTAKLQVWFTGPVQPKGTPEYVLMQIDYTTPTGSPSTPPSHSGGGGGGPSFSGAIKGYAGKCLDDSGNSSSLRAKVAIAKCNGGKSQKWQWVKGELKHNNLCANAKGNGKVILWTCNGASNEIWILNTLDHQWKLRAHNYSQCLTDPGNSKKDGTQVTAATCKNSAGQHWSLPGGH